MKVPTFNDFPRYWEEPTTNDTGWTRCFVCNKDLKRKSTAHITFTNPKNQQIGYQKDFCRNCYNELLAPFLNRIDAFNNIEGRPLTEEEREEAIREDEKQKADLAISFWEITNKRLQQEIDALKNSQEKEKHS